MTLHPLVLEGVKRRMGWPGLRPVQELAADAIARQGTVLVTAPTAGGKTEAALLPLLSRVLWERRGGLAIVYIAPMKALLNDLGPRAERLAALAGLTAGVWHGDTPAAERRLILAEPPSVLFATPESIEAMLLTRAPAARAMLSGAMAVVVDELHAWAPSLRGVQLCALLARLERLALDAGGQAPQRVGLSATVADPPALLEWFDHGGNAPREVVCPPPAPVDRRIEVVVAASDAELVDCVAPVLVRERCLVFCATRRATEAVGALFGSAGLRVGVHHGGVGAQSREATEASARAGAIDVVCTSTLEMGIDLGALDRVIQIGPPPSVTSLMQRLGRSGRRGGPSTMLMVARDADEAQTCRAMSKLALDGWLEPIAPVTASAVVFGQQARAMCVADAGLDATHLAWVCARTAGLSAFAPRVADELEALAKSGDLERLDDHRWVLTPTAERRLQYRGYSRLCSVITDPSGATVEHRTPDGTLLVGELRPAEAGRLAAGDEVRLGGRAWVVREVAGGVVWV